MSIPITLVAVILFPAIIWAQDSIKRDEHQMHGHDDPRAYIGALEDPKRDTYQKPQEVLAALNIKAGEVIADIGAGSGYFTFRLAQHVSAKGKVYAVDVSPDMIKHINRRIRELKATNVVSVLADPDDPLLPDPSVDRFFFSDSWHHIDNKNKYLALIKQMLKPGGVVIMIDFHKKELPVARRRR
ncbi:MAG: class I SAM-dependent methyltransferase [Candidatus Binatia bacterium]